MEQLADGRVVSGSRDRTLRVWDSVSGECTLQLGGHTGAVRCVVHLATAGS
jgi:WD40 repeat protein